MTKVQQHGKRSGGVRAFITVITICLAAAAIIKELRTPAEERTWNGKVAAIVPYDFRIPTVARIRDRLWNPEAEHLVGPRVFGVGWALNFGKAFAVAREKIQQARAT